MGVLRGPLTGPLTGVLTGYSLGYSQGGALQRTHGCDAARVCVHLRSPDSAGYSRVLGSTHGVLTGYSRILGSTHGVLNRTCRPRATFGAPAAVSTGVCDAWPLAIRATCSVLTGYSRGTHGVLTGYSRGHPFPLHLSPKLAAVAAIHGCNSRRL
jgi:hypothetical protein